MGAAGTTGPGPRHLKKLVEPNATDEATGRERERETERKREREMICDALILI